MKTTEQTAGDVIFEQLGGARAMAMAGGTGTAVAGEKDLTFAVKGSKAANKVRIVLDGDDTYTIELWKGRGVNIARSVALAGIYVGDLRRTVEIWTGLQLSLGTCGR